MNISNEWMIFNNRIINKNMKQAFKINHTLYEDLKSLFYEKKVNLKDSEISFLNEYNIFAETNDFYDPFVLTSNLSDDFRIFIQVTNQCNLHCAHCYANSSMGMKQFFDEESLIKVIQNAYELGITRVDFTGGEVFTQKFFFEFLKKLDFYPISYSIFTNLTLLNDDKISFISNLKGLYRIVTSVDYFDPYKHDRFRGKKGSYAKTINNILSLKSKNVDVVVNTIVNEENYEDVEKLVSFFSEKNIEVHLDTIVDCGRAKTFRNIGKMDENLSFIKTVLNSNKCVLNKDKITKNVCGVGENFVFLDYLGYYNLCTGLNRELDSSFNLGRDMEQAIQNIKLFNLSCTNKHCRYSENKSCVCRHRAYLNHNRIDAPDELICEFVKMINEGDTL